MPQAGSFSGSKGLKAQQMRRKADTQVCYEVLEPKLPMAGDVSFSRSELMAPEVVLINNAAVGPAPITFERAVFFSDGIESFLVGHVASSVVEKFDGTTNSWRDISRTPTTSNPRQLLQALSARLIQDGDQIR